MVVATNKEDIIKLPDASQPLLPRVGNDAPPTHSKLGIMLVICSCILFSGMHTGVRYATEKLDFEPTFLAFCRGLVQLFLITTVIVFYGPGRFIPELTRKTAIFLVLRGFAGSVAMFSKFESLSHLPVGIAVSLFSTSPMFAGLFSWICLGESLTVSEVISMALCMFGATIVGMSNGPLKLDGHIAGVALGLFAAAMTGGTFTVIRGLGTRVHFFLSVYALSIGSMLTPFLFRVLQVGSIDEACKFIGDNLRKTFSSGEAMIAVGAIGSFAFVAALCINRALQIVGAGKAATIKTLDIPINFLTGCLVMGELPHATGQVVGCVLIAIATYVNVAGKRRS